MSDNRISRDMMFMLMAVAAAQRSACRRRKVGVIITSIDGTQVLGIGYNGNARGLPNDCDTDEAGACGCIHAEVNALIKTPYDRGDLVMYTTLEPCLSCAKLVLNSAVTKLVYTKSYRSHAGIQLLMDEGVKVELCAAPLLQLAILEMENSVGAL